MEDRLLFGHPINRHTTAYFYAEKMSLREFVMQMRSAINVFEQDMEHYSKLGDYYGQCKPKYIEGWIHLLLKMSEIEQEKTVHHPEPRLREIEDFKREIMKAV